MILLALAATALAAPPRAEVAGGWAGNTDQGFAYLAAQTSVARNPEAGLFVRGGGTNLHYRYYEGGREVRVHSPGVSLGVGFTYMAGPVSLSLGSSLEGRVTTRDEPELSSGGEVAFGGVLSSSLYWAPWRRMTMYTAASFSGIDGYLWTRAGASHQVVPRLSSSTPYALWLGADGTGRGNEEARAAEVGAVAELRARELRTSLALRAGLAVEWAGERSFQQPTVGVSGYWWY